MRQSNSSNLRLADQVRPDVASSNPEALKTTSSTEVFIMSVETVGNTLVELCNQGKNFDVMRRTYDRDIVSVEGDGRETVGQGPVIKKSEDWVADRIFHGERALGPYFKGPDQFAVHLQSTSRGTLLASASAFKEV